MQGGNVAAQIERRDFAWLRQAAVELLHVVEERGEIFAIRLRGEIRSVPFDGQESQELSDSGLHVKLSRRG